MSADIRAALERMIELHNADGAWGLHWTDAIAAARAALAADPVGEGPSDDPSVDEVLGLAAIIREVDGGNRLGAAALAEAILARWGRPIAPPAPEPGEVGELVLSLLETAAKLDDDWYHASARIMRRAATLLSQQAAPAPVVVPVVVSERLPGEGDCDAYEYCWWWTPCVACWEFRSRNRQKVHDTHWLPAHAIPLPQVREVQE